ncbi:MAG: PilT/PilU family type 4a pilus ATPase [Rickettsiales bacterium]|nr:PilT/PilU family type 4a pilus ATPase [Rickettsiales bacterium]
MSEQTLNRDVLLQTMLEQQASDLYITVGCPASFRSEKGIQAIGEPLTRDIIYGLIDEILTPKQRAEFDEVMEFNSAYGWQDKGRFRINVFMQQHEPGMVIRRINTVIPTFEDLNLGEAYRDLVMHKRGLVLVVGPTGSGKSSSLAAMIGHRNEKGSGHIITVEDPIEFQHSHKGCIVTQRDVGIDTASFEAALKNALRQRPDVVLVGEIRDRDTMEHAINFAETGHLCLATLHANNCPQTIERILSFFPEEKHRQVQMNLALNLKGILSQRLVKNRMGGRCIVSEVMLNEGLIRELIEEGNVKEMRQVMERNSDIGMQTFDQALLARYIRGEVTEEVALAESDNPQNLKLKMRQAAGAVTTAGLVNAANVSPTNNTEDSSDGGGAARHHLEI